ncbi:hypothetical protein CP985_03185 [Malaciobacter mytili LMG 24559]|uniref:Uncharacterized protein n=1 Tax=Malaciobacter mytili LMG 24559 TaxID=1032238 RepID=A0AAX2AK21_9BACT|nr:hypothetical protein [Malaciobacter mytili]AXH16362.1 hypothetical protein AMYT_a0062 [Malaciobacter mytili LMG 24559]RXK16428.1 hypothetical protein CP985_03185 [Malaciobacter mytili LMG 24559]
MTVENLSKKALLEMIESFEYYPAVTEADDRAYILAYLDDEACAISKDDIQEYIDAIEITEDNIHEFYEFMNDEDLIKNKDLIHEVIFENKMEVFSKLFEKDLINEKDFPECNNILCFQGFVLKYSLFGIIDTLKPIDEYIQEIKNSEAYQQYISNKNVDANNISCPKNIKDLIEKFIPEFDYNQDNNIYGKDAHANTRADLERFVNELQQLIGIKSIQINADEVNNDVYNELRSKTNAIIHRRDTKDEFIIFNTIKNGVLL